MPAFVNDNLIWIIAAVVIGVAALLWVMRSGKAPAIPDADPTIEAVEAPPVPAPIPVGDMTGIGIPIAIGPPDNLMLLKGVGPKLNTMLTGFGITRFDQIAAWGDSEVAAVDPHLGAFQGRIARDNWIEQAGLLASGDIAAFEAKFGKLDGQTA
jgi:predicted flap endonuclease-1-like 5' DNA nuclease